MAPISPAASRIDSKPLWQRLDPSPRISTRFFTRRLFLRVLSLLSICVVLYNVVYNAELRGRLEKVQVLGDAGQPHDRMDTAEPEDGSSSAACYDTGFGQNGTEKASLVMLVRNSELREALSSIRMIEDRFNRRFHYPWTFLNDKPFTDDVSEHLISRRPSPTDFG